jgi:hypothetical protein
MVMALDIQVSACRIARSRLTRALMVLCYASQEVERC